jgi:hypothetical protein
MTFTEGFDANGDATITGNDGSAVAGEFNCFIRCKGIDWSLSRNIIGQVSEVYTPTVIQLATEKDPTGADSTHVLTRQQIGTLLGCILSRGTRVEWYTSATTVIPVIGTITGAADFTWEASLQHGMRSSQ